MPYRTVLQYLISQNISKKRTNPDLFEVFEGGGLFSLEKKLDRRKG